MGEATFQTIIVSNWESSYALMYYLSGAMKWPPKEGRPYIYIGASDGAGNIQTAIYSGNKQAYSIDTEIGNTGIHVFGALSHV